MKNSKLTYAKVPARPLVRPPIRIDLNPRKKRHERRGRPVLLRRGHHSFNSTASFAPVLYVAFELSSGLWKLASTTARGQRARVVSVQARNSAAVLREIARAKARFGVAESAVVYFCYEAGRDGFWLHRCLHHHDINNVIVDSSSIDVNRRARRAKADGLDAVSLVGLLARYGEGETKVRSTVSVPDPADEGRKDTHCNARSYPESGWRGQP